MICCARLINASSSYCVVPRPPRRHDGEAWMRTLLTLVSALAVMSAPAVAQKGAPVDAVVRRTIDQTIWVAPAGYIRISHLAGTLRVEGWDRDSLSIEGVLSMPAAAEFVVTPGKQG